MGIWHFAGLGKSPGAVTAGLACIREQYETRHPQYGSTVDGLVIFTSPEIVTGKEISFPATHNTMWKNHIKEQWPKQHQNAVDIVKEFVKREFPKSEVYVVTVNVNEFSACFEAVATAILKFHTPGKVGKHIWANITGGSNVLNAAMTQVAYLSGFIVRLYYTFIADVRTNGSFLQPFSKSEAAFRYDEIYPLRTGFESRHRIMLEMLEQTSSLQSAQFISSDELLNRLKGAFPQEFGSLSRQEFIRNFLNSMEGYTIEQQGNRQEGQKDAIRLAEDGHKLLNMMRQPLMRALVEREQIDEDELQQIISRLNIKQIR